MAHAVGAHRDEAVRRQVAEILARENAVGGAADRAGPRPLPEPAKRAGPLAAGQRSEHGGERAQEAMTRRRIVRVENAPRRVGSASLDRVAGGAVEIPRVPTPVDL